ncbi:calcium-binding protein [Conexibacter sp. SYSU D00693]|uniref:calcium-binding protein n=1 Tax=Conexibacter sp. SYSU D00693 TaxID=2812560 RepID=UPI00196A3B8B|nr:calcium-binding protein [Conexibacter sp. SYSU D00693]
MALMRRLTLAAVAVTALLPSPAQAAHAAVETLGSGKDVSRIVGLRYAAEPGEANALRVTQSGSTLMLQDARAVVRAGGGCTAQSPHEVRCELPSSVGGGTPTDPWVFAELGDGDDFALTASGADILRGGDGNDFLDGGPGNDTLEGGSGSDVLRSTDGFDRVYGGEGYDQVLLDPTRPLGDPDALVSAWPRAATAFCEGGTVTGARLADRIGRCDRVSLGLGDVAARPRFSASAARFTLRCPAPQRGRCTGRIEVGGRRRGEARFDFPNGTLKTVTVPLRRGRRTTNRYGFVISGNGRLGKQRLPMRASWSIDITSR